VYYSSLFTIFKGQLAMHAYYYESHFVILLIDFYSCHISFMQI